MGLYDNTCSLTGVSLWANEGALVLLEGSEPAFRPVTLVVKGSQNRAGAIDGIRADPNVGRIARFVEEQFLAEGLVIGEDRYSPQGKSQKEDVENFFQACERNLADGQRNGLTENPLCPAVICCTIWDALVERVKVPGSPSEHFQQVFGENRTARAIYGDDLSPFATQLAEQAAIAEVLRRHQLGWKPSLPGGQHSNDDVRQYIREAKQAFAGSPLMLEVLEIYEYDMEAQMEEDE